VSAPPAHALSRRQARRIAVRAQLLDASRPTDLVSTVEQLTMLQLDPTAAVAPSADLVLWSRLGRAYRPEHLRHALERDGTLFELHGMARPMTDLRLFLAEMRLAPRYENTRHWLEVYDPFRRDILARLLDLGPLLAREIPDTSLVPWRSSGWTNNRNVTQMLEILAMRGEVAIAGRRDGQKEWDLAERVYPDTTEVPLAEAQRIRDERRLAALGIVRETAQDLPMEPGGVGEAGERATVDGLPGYWRVDPAALAATDEPFAGRTVLLSPYDRLVYDRARLAELFEFEYILEMYKPKARRRWGYYALPILHGERFVGKLDATADRKAGTLRVDAIHDDVGFSKAVTSAVHRQITELADWLGLPVSGLTTGGAGASTRQARPPGGAARRV
jgi:uncharacterized protein YcaQ